MTIETAISVPASWHQMKMTILENSAQLPEEASAAARQAEVRSQVMLVRGAFIDAAILRAKADGMTSGSRDAWDHIEVANEIADNLVYPAMTGMPFDMKARAALTADEVRDGYALTVFGDTDPMYAARTGRKLQLDLESFEQGVGGYLRSDYRIPVVDRLIVTALIDFEITAYLHTVMFPNVFSVTSPFDAFGGGRHPVNMWLRGQGRALIAFALVIACSIGLRMINLIEPGTTFLIILGTVGVAILGFCITLGALTLYIPQWRKRRPILVDLPNDMCRFSRELHAPGPVSVRRIREGAQALEAQGTVWPSSLWVMLDDLDARGVIVECPH